MLLFFKKILKSTFIFLLITSWLMSGFPQIFNFPPKIQKALAATSLPTYVASGTFTVATTTAITPPYPANMLANDVCLLVVESENQAIALTTANGFVEVLNSPQFAGTAATNPANRIAVYWKRTVGSDSAPVVTASGNHNTGQVHCFRGVIGTGNPWDVTAGGNDSAVNDTTGVIPGATTAVVNTLVVLIQGTSFDGNSTVQCSAWTNSNLANILERTDNTTNSAAGGGHCMATGEKATASAYTSTTVTLANTSFKGALSIALKPPVPTYNQSAYRFFNNVNSTDVGTALAVQDTVATLGSTGAAFRLRMLLHTGADYLPVNGENFKLQFAQQSGTCDTAFTGETYADVTVATLIAYNDNLTPVDNATLTANANDPAHGVDIIVNQTYEALNNFTNSVAAIPSGQDGKWDFSLKDNSAPASTAYCFRAVQSDGTVLNTYTVIPQITTAVAAPPQTLTFSLGANSLALGTLSTTAVTSGSHTLLVGTNAVNGVTVTYSGLTLTSGANTITSMSTSTASSVGTEQFGINAVANTSPTVGAACSGTPPITVAATGYATANNFKFVSGETIVSSTGSVNDTTCTISYITNISNITEASTYNATLTYIITANF